MSDIESLADQMISTGHSLYCVVDGALIDDVKGILRKERFDGYPLFYDKTHSGLYLAGPWLIHLGSKAETLRCFAVARHYDCGVAWNVCSTSDEFSKHLRALNMARLPNEGLVYFRHYDPDVLASVCPLLDEDQAARLLGPAECVGFVSGRGRGSTVSRPRDLPTPPPGLLTFYEWQVEKLEERQRELSRQKICDFLRYVLPRETRTRSDQELIGDIARHEQSAKSLGLDTERSITQWVHLSLLSRGASIQEPAVRATVLKGGPAEANKNLDENFFGMLEHFEQRRLRQ